MMTNSTAEMSPPLSKRRRIALDLTVNGLLVGWSALWLIPLIWTVAAAFDSQSQITANGLAWLPTHPILTNFSDAWSSGDFSAYFSNTVIIVVTLVVVQTFFASLAGYAFARYRFFGKQALFVLYLLQIMLPISALLLPNYETINQLGLTDTKLAIMLPYFASGFGVFLMRQAFRGVPRELEDAAVLDGCSWYRVIWHVFLPVTRPSLSAFALVSISFHWNDFFWPLIVTNSASSRPISVGLALLTASQESGTQWNMVMAGTVIVVTPLLLLFLVFQRAFINSLARSGLK